MMSNPALDELDVVGGSRLLLLPYVRMKVVHLSACEAVSYCLIELSSIVKKLFDLDRIRWIQDFCSHADSL